MAFNHPTLGVDNFARLWSDRNHQGFHLSFLAQRGAKRIVHIDHGYAPLTHRPRRNLDAAAGPEDYDWDVSYVGVASPHKANWLDIVARSFGDIRFAVFGQGWDQFAHTSALKRHIVGFPITGDSYANTIERTRINLAVHFGPVGADHWQDSNSSRTFHIPAAGGFMLHIDNLDVRALYDVPGEIDVFGSPDQLIERISHHLSHEAERNASLHAVMRVVPPPTASARGREIFSISQAVFSVESAAHRGGRRVLVRSDRRWADAWFARPWSRRQRSLQSYHFMTGGGLARRALVMTSTSIASYRRELLRTA